MPFRPFTLQVYTYFQKKVHREVDLKSGKSPKNTQKIAGVQSCSCTTSIGFGCEIKEKDGPYSKANIC